MKKTTFAFLCILIGLIVALVYFARQGDIWSAAILAALWTMAAITFGALIVMYVIRQRDIKQSADFTANARENLLLMQQLQRLQNLQNKGLMNQIGKLPPPQNGLVIDDGLFDELE